MIFSTEDSLFRMLESAFGADCWEAESSSGESLQPPDNCGSPHVDHKPQIHRSSRHPTCQACNR
jgi:hypothetical protein